LSAGSAWVSCGRSAEASKAQIEGIPSHNDAGTHSVDAIRCAAGSTAAVATPATISAVTSVASYAYFIAIGLANNLFLLFKMDFANGTEYRQQIKTFRWKYIFLAGKIIRMARSVVLKLSTNYPFQKIYAKSLS